MVSGVLLPVLPGLQAHASGAVWLPESRTVIIADLHLGYSWAQRRRGELGPLADTRTREKLLGCRDELRPERFVFLGDIVHAPRSCEPEREWIIETLRQLSRGAELIAVRGNHDRQFAAEFADLKLIHVEAWSHQLLTAIHGDRFEFAWPEDHTHSVACFFAVCARVRRGLRFTCRNAEVLRTGKYLCIRSQRQTGGPLRTAEIIA
jgi:hypothetical protein